MLTCSDLSCQYAENKVFSSLSFSLYARSCLIVKGPNGSGKTSLLKIIAGLKTPEHGEVLLDTEHGVKVGYHDHNLAIKPNLSVIDNLIFWAELNNMTLALRAAISYFRLGDIADVKVSKLSAGLKKRLALSRLLLTDTDLWLLDEPDNNLDSESLIRLQNLIEQKLSNNGTVILTTHSNFKIQSAVTLDLGDFKTL